jgi:hypothetical protein
MRGLKQVEEVEQVQIKHPETNFTQEVTLMDKIHQFVGRMKQKRTARKIENGKLPHGRTEGVVSGVNAAVVNANTLLQVRHYRAGSEVPEDYREVHNRVVTNAGRDAIVDAFTGAFDLSTFNYHDCGTGTTAEGVTNTTLVTPISEARVTGVQSQPTSDTYQSIGTFTFASTYAITEHGLFSQSARPGGVLLDRTVFPPINVTSGDKIEFTFTLSFTAGG